MKCRQLSDKENISAQQYNDIAELIYETDSYIYSALFGEKNGIETISKLIPDIIESNNDDMFTRRNLFVTEENNRIIALILWYKGTLTWNATTLYSYAEKYNIKLNKEDIELVREKYFDSCYKNSSPNNLISLINVCVKKDKRGQGVGSLLLSEFINSHLNEDMKLTVLKNNQAAVELYQSHGFVITLEEEGFALGVEKPLCYTMIRKHLFE